MENHQGSKSNKRRRIGETMKYFILIYLLLSYNPCHQQVSANEVDLPIILSQEDLSRIRLKEMPKVNGILLSSADYEDHMKVLLTKHKNPQGKLFDALKLRALKLLAETEMLRQALTTHNLMVTDAEIEEKIKNRKKSFTNIGQFEQFLMRQGDDLKTLRKIIFNEVAMKKLIELKALVKISEEDLQKKYKQLEDRFIQPYRIKARHIMIAFSSENATEAEIEEKRIKIAEYHAQILQGESMSKLASLFSDSPDRVKQGDLGFFAKGESLIELEREAFQLKVGELSVPFKSKYGWHLIRVEEEQKAHTQPFEKTKEYLAELIFGEKYFQVKAEFLKQLWQTTKIDSEVALK
jgi:parvulin-like peptidyl-prolyl isomerase